MRTREGLSSITANMGFNNYGLSQGYKVGKIYAVILGPQSVSSGVWEANGQWSGVGTVLYQEYNETNEINIENTNGNTISSLPTALPLFPNQKYFPLPGEIVLLLDLPSAPSPITNKTQETYYLSTINAWNSPQFNGLFLDSSQNVLYDTFSEDSEFRGLQAFEGDYILEGRFGNSIRFGSTNQSGDTGLNFWSKGSANPGSNPITLISNKHNLKAYNSDLFVEDINEDDSSLYLTSTQKISLDIGNIRLSNITSPTSIQDYSDPQILINSGRVVISSKSDEILLFGKTGIELYSQGPLYFQSNKIGITLQDDLIFLGPSNNNQITQPLVLGSDLKVFLSNIVKSLSDFCTSLSDVKSTPEGTPILELSAASSAFQIAVKSLIVQLDNPDYMLSKTTYTL